MAWPNFFQRRVWALVFSYALPAISPGPILTIVALYLNQRLAVDAVRRQPGRLDPAAHVGHRVLFLGMGGRRFAANNPRPIAMFLLLTVASLTLGMTTWTTSVPIAIALISFSTFIGGGFQMVALKVGSYAFPREQSAMMSGHRVRIVVARELHPAACDRPVVELDEQPAMGRNLLVDRCFACGRDRGLAGSEPQSDGGGAQRSRDGLVAVSVCGSGLHGPCC